jgi:MFS family permease
VVTETQNEQFFLSLGDCRCRRTAGLHCDRRHVFIAGFPSAHLARYRVVSHRRVERHDHRISFYGVREHRLGQSVRSPGSPDNSVDRISNPGCSLFLASKATSLLGFQLIFGLAVGGSVAAIFAPLMACVTGWFDTHRSLAVSLVSAGMGMAPLTMSPLAAWLVSIYDWRTSLQIIAVLVAAVMIPAALLVRPPPALAAENTAATDEEPQCGMTLQQVIRSPQFIILLLTNFFCCATHSGPIFHTVSYAISCGIPLIAAVSIYSVEGLAGMGGRVAFGILGDRFGAKHILVAGLLLQAFGALAYFFVRDLGAFYAVAALFGFIYAGVMPLYAVLARENFPLRLMGTVIGGTAMAGGLGMATGPLAGGMIYDTFASYGWLFIGSFGIGIGAFLIAMTFKPFPKPQPALAPAQ